MCCQSQKHSLPPLSPSFSPCKYCDIYADWRGSRFRFSMCCLHSPSCLPDCYSLDLFDLSLSLLHYFCHAFEWSEVKISVRTIGTPYAQLKLMNSWTLTPGLIRKWLGGVHTVWINAHLRLLVPDLRYFQDTRCKIVCSYDWRYVMVKCREEGKYFCLWINIVFNMHSSMCQFIFW